MEVPSRTTTSKFSARPIPLRNGRDSRAKDVKNSASDSEKIKPPPAQCSMVGSKVVSTDKLERLFGPISPERHARDSRAEAAKNSAIDSEKIRPRKLQMKVEADRVPYEKDGSRNGRDSEKVKPQKLQMKVEAAAQRSMVDLEIFSTDKLGRLFGPIFPERNARGSRDKAVKNSASDSEKIKSPPAQGSMVGLEVVSTEKLERLFGPITPERNARDSKAEAVKNSASDSEKIRPRKLQMKVEADRVPNEKDGSRNGRDSKAKDVKNSASDSEKIKPQPAQRSMVGLEVVSTEKLERLFGPITPDRNACDSRAEAVKNIASDLEKIKPPPAQRSMVGLKVVSTEKLERLFGPITPERNARNAKAEAVKNSVSGSEKFRPRKLQMKVEADRVPYEKDGSRNGRDSSAKAVKNSVSDSEKFRPRKLQMKVEADRVPYEKDGSRNGRDSSAKAVKNSVSDSEKFRPRKLQMKVEADRVPYEKDGSRNGRDSSAKAVKNSASDSEKVKPQKSQMKVEAAAQRSIVDLEIVSTDKLEKLFGPISPERNARGSRDNAVKNSASDSEKIKPPPAHRSMVGLEVVSTDKLERLFGPISPERNASESRVEAVKNSASDSEKIRQRKSQMKVEADRVHYEKDGSRNGRDSRAKDVRNSASDSEKIKPPPAQRSMVGLKVVSTEKLERLFGPITPERNARDSRAKAVKYRASDSEKIKPPPAQRSMVGLEVVSTEKLERLFGPVTPERNARDSKAEAVKNSASDSEKIGPRKLQMKVKADRVHYEKNESRNGRDSRAKDVKSSASHSQKIKPQKLQMKVEAAAQRSMVDLEIFSTDKLGRLFGPIFPERNARGSRAKDVKNSASHSQKIKPQKLQMKVEAAAQRSMVDLEIFSTDKLGRLFGPIFPERNARGSRDKAVKNSASDSEKIKSPPAQGSMVGLEVVSTEKLERLFGPITPERNARDSKAEAVKNSASDSEKIRPRKLQMKVEADRVPNEKDGSRNGHDSRVKAVKNSASDSEKIKPQPAQRSMVGLEVVSTEKLERLFGPITPKRNSRDSKAEALKNSASDLEKIKPPPAQRSMVVLEVVSTEKLERLFGPITLERNARDPNAEAVKNSASDSEKIRPRKLQMKVKADRVPYEKDGSRNGRDSRAKDVKNSASDSEKSKPPPEQRSMVGLKVVSTENLERLFGPIIPDRSARDSRDGAVKNSASDSEKFRPRKLQMKVEADRVLNEKNVSRNGRDFRAEAVENSASDSEKTKPQKLQMKVKAHRVRGKLDDHGKNPRSESATSTSLPGFRVSTVDMLFSPISPDGVRSSGFQGASVKTVDIVPNKRTCKRSFDEPDIHLSKRTKTG